MEAWWWVSFETGTTLKLRVNPSGPVIRMELSSFARWVASPSVAQIPTIQPS